MGRSSQRATHREEGTTTVEFPRIRSPVLLAFAERSLEETTEVDKARGQRKVDPCPVGGPDSSPVV